MKQMKDLYRHILDKGVRKTNRTGIDTISVFGYQMRFDLTKGFPICTSKAVSFKNVAAELLWFLRGEQDKPGAIEDLHASNCKIWDEWAKPDGSFGRIYGVQWRRWLGFHGHEVDQIAQLINQLKTTPDNRRMIVTAWRPDELAGMALPPCHVLFQLNTRPRGDGTYFVDLQLYQRSCDAFLGVPYNVSSYALLLTLLCRAAGPQYTPGDFVWTGGDVHLYVNHANQVGEYLSNPTHPLPELVLNPEVTDIDAWTLEDMRLSGYKHSGAIKAPVAV